MTTEPKATHQATRRLQLGGKRITDPGSKAVGTFHVPYPPQKAKLFENKRTARGVCLLLSEWLAVNRFWMSQLNTSPPMRWKVGCQRDGRGHNQRVRCANVVIVMTLSDCIKAAGTRFL